MAETLCRHCHRTIVDEHDVWIDPEATGDDSIWRETCDDHDTFVADHEPYPPAERYLAACEDVDIPAVSWMAQGGGASDGVADDIPPTGWVAVGVGEDPAEWFERADYRADWVRPIGEVPGSGVLTFRVRPA